MTKAILRAVLVLNLASALGFAQSETGRAAVQGPVIDQTGKSIPAAEITLCQSETGFLRTITGNADGEFEFEGRQTSCAGSKVSGSRGIAGR